MTNLRVIGLLAVLGVAALSWLLTFGAWRLDRVAAGAGPLGAREFQSFTVITVGTGGARENPDRLGPVTAVALGLQIALVDAGRAVAEALRAAAIPVSQPDAVLLTSLLPENTLGLDDLLLSAWLDGRRTPVRLVGPPGTRALAEGLVAGRRPGLAAVAEARGLAAAAPRFDVEEVGDGWETRWGELSVRAGALPGGPVAALAYRFEARDRAAVVAATGWAQEALVAFTRGAHLLVHDAAHIPTPELAARAGLAIDPEQLRREASLHTSIDAVGGLARRAGVETLVLVRLRPPPVYDLQLTRIVGQGFAGRIVIADDGEEITP